MALRFFMGSAWDEKRVRKGHGSHLARIETRINEHQGCGKGPSLITDLPLRTPLWLHSTQRIQLSRAQYQIHRIGGTTNATTGGGHESTITTSTRSLNDSNTNSLDVLGTSGHNRNALATSVRDKESSGWYQPVPYLSRRGAAPNCGLGVWRVDLYGSRSRDNQRVKRGVGSELR